MILDSETVRHTMQMREVVATLPVGLHRVTVESSTDWIYNELVVRMRARVLSDDLVPARIPVHVTRKVTTTVPVKRTLERPWRRWDALRLAFGAPAHRVQWVSATYYEDQEVTVWLEADEEVVIDRAVMFPEATIQYPENFGRAVMVEWVRADD